MNTTIDYTRIKNYINGEWVEERDVEYVPLYNPSTCETIGEVPLSAPETSSSAVAAACPLCATMLRDGLADREANVAVKDIAELMDELTG